MVGGAAAAFGALEQGIEQCAQHMDVPAVTWAEYFFERLPQLPHFLGRHIQRLAAEDALDLRNGCGELCLALGFVVARVLRCIAGGLCAQIEGQHPLLIRIIGRDAAHLQRADLGQAGLQLHFDRCAL